MQTLHLAELLTRARFTAVDNLQEYLDELQRRAREQGVADRIQVLRADMGDLKLQDGSYDLIWSEGAAYSIGLERALQHWRGFLLPGGHLAFTELVWFQEGPPPEAVRYWAQGYPEMRLREAVGELIQGSGYELVEAFDLPPQDWWSHYYDPLEEKIPSFRETHVGEADAQAVADEVQEEMDMHRRFSHCYGYSFFVARRGR
jgi:SAM-dependent methyltransferase